MIRMVTNAARAAPEPTRLCVVCDVALRRSVAGDRCEWHPAKGLMCACGQALYPKNLTGLCRECLVLRNGLPMPCHAEFERRVRSGEDFPDRIAAAMRKRIAEQKRLAAEADAELRARAGVNPAIGIPALVIDAMAERLGVSVSDIVAPAGGPRPQELVHARAAVAMVLVGRGYSRPQIGRRIGGRDHSSVINWERKFARYCAVDPRLPGVVRDVAALAGTRDAERILAGGSDEPV